jgi:glycolate oxidase FAD binding subunit
MVVKNVAGLDMGKLMIGSFGTLAAMTSVNFKLVPVPEQSRTFVFEYKSAGASAAKVGELLRGQLQPVAMDIFHSQEASNLFVLAAGSERVVARYQREFGHPGYDEKVGEPFWDSRQLPFRSAATVRISCPLSEVGAVLDALPRIALARAGNGVVYGLFEDWQTAATWARESRWAAVIESAAPDCPAEVRWPKPGPAFATMEKVKAMFDPKRLLNPGRLYGRI